MIKTLPLHTNWTFQSPKSKAWLKAEVPGTIHTDLLRNKLIPDPFWGKNEDDLQWIEETIWHYRTEFVLKDSLFVAEHIELVADGLDTLAVIRLNGLEIGRTENMFLAHRYEVKDALKSGKNLLEITFESPMNYIRARQKTSDFHEWNDPVGGSSHLRKSGASFGWDWGPRFATCGIYKSIRLEAWSEVRFESVQVRQTHRKGAVDLSIEPRFAGRSSGEVRGTVEFNGDVVATFSQNQATIKAPQLWWPNGYGTQPLYTIKLEYVQNGKVLDRWTERLGLRSILLDRHPDEFGESFQFVVNGLPIFAKGANWIPAHSFVTVPDRAFYDNLLTSATAAHMNMMRVWGGGIYEMDAFYDLCDEKGLLVWQDFMFACAQYPGTAKFQKLVKLEAEYQVKRLANRTCLALWCGNNEIEQMVPEIVKTPQRKKAYEDVFYKVLPAAVAKWDGVTAYWPCSPHNPEGYETGFNNERAGDAHFWEVWHARKPVKLYETTRFRFCSEFGMQSYSSPEVAATFCPPDKFNVFGPAMECHQKNGAGNLIILDYVTRRYRLPKDYASLAYLSQLNQAYCMAVGIEHFRRSMPRTMGALYWQLNDCWPVFSWSSIEFGGKWKALHFAAKRFFAPALVSAHVPGDESIWIGNAIRSTIDEVHLHTVYEGIHPTSGVLGWTLFHLDGRTLSHGGKKVSLKYGEARLQKTLSFKKDMAKHGSAHIYLRICLVTTDGQTSDSTVFLTAPRYMELPKTPVTHTVSQLSEREFELSFRAKNFHHQMQFELEGISYLAEANFFDLYPSEARKVKITTSRPVAKVDIEKRLTVRSLVDSY
ncbi:glycoside hydrolase family 2 protein [soil metagenome]